MSAPDRPQPPRRACGSATSPASSAPRRGRSATTRRSACSPRRPRGPPGQHRIYTEAEVERLREVMRLKDLLGVSLEELKTLLTAEEARAEVRAQLRREDVDPERRRELLSEALGHIDRQLELVRRRAAELGKLQEELCETRKRVRRKIRGLDAATEGTFPPALGERCAGERARGARRRPGRALRRAEGRRRRLLRGRAGRGVRPARAERRGQDDDDPRAHDAAWRPPRDARSWPASTSATTASRCAPASATSPRRSRSTAR